MVSENRILSFNTLHTTATTQCNLDFVGKGWKIELSSNALHFTIPSFCHTIYLCKSLHLCIHRIIIYSTFQQVLKDWLYSVILEIGVICFMGVPRYLGVWCDCEWARQSVLSNFTFVFLSASFS